MSKFTPNIPTFTRSRGKDGKFRLYLIASNRADIELMLHLSGCFQQGVTCQQDKNVDLWYRIIKRNEEKMVFSVFPQETMCAGCGDSRNGRNGFDLLDISGWACSEKCMDNVI